MLRTLSFQYVIKAMLVALLLVKFSSCMRADSADGRGGYIHRAGNPRVIVFVHGLYGSPETWRCGEQKSWPEMIAADKDPAFQSSDVYVASYPSPKSGNQMAISDLVSLISNRLAGDEVFSSHRQVIFVAHSLGGLLVQQLLLTYRDPEALSKVQFLYLFGTPLEGSSVANIFQHFSGDPLVKELKSGDGNFVLRGMDEQWLHAHFKVPRYCAYETKDEHGLKIVHYNSATRGCDDNVAIPENHSDIVKPCDQHADSYVALKAKLADLPFGSISADVSIETDFSMNPVEGFQQQFTVTNNGPGQLFNLHYACVINSIELKSGHDPLFAAASGSGHPFNIAMIPVMGATPKLNRRAKTTIDCDYFTRPNKDLLTASIYLIAAFTTQDGKSEMYTPVGFSGRRDADGNFRWTHGSAFPSPLEGQPEGQPKPTMLIQPFGGDNRYLSARPTPESFVKIITAWIPVFKEEGFTVFVGTLPSGNY